VVRWALVLASLGGCDYITDSFVTNDFSGDQFPTTIQTQSGALIVGLTDSDDNDMHNAVLDVMSPLNVIDRGASAAASIDDYATFQLYGQRAPFGPLDLERAQFSNQDLVTLHPCSTDTCTVGTPDAPEAFDAIVGMPAFASDALRLHLAPDTTSGTDVMYILPNIAGSEGARSYSCDADFPLPFRGGGTIVIGGTELGFTNWRIAIDACMTPNPDPEALQSQRGTDALFVASTAIGISILGVSAYERYRIDHPDVPDIDALPMDSVLLESETITGYRTSLASMALVADSATNPRAPCRQVWASHLLVQHDCEPGDDCPCIPDQDPNNGTFCAVPAVVELNPPGGFDLLIVDDDNDTLQALRTELRPDQPEVDGILGTQALRTIELDIDYPNDRLLGRCTNLDPAVCVARPELVEETGRTQIQGCLEND
jgi:hypothetical protein